MISDTACLCGTGDCDRVALQTCFFFLMIRRPPRSTRTDTLFPYTTLFRSGVTVLRGFPQGNSEAFKKRLAAIWSTRSEEHTSELQSLMRISYAVFCLKKKKKHNNQQTKQLSNHGMNTNVKHTLQPTPCRHDNYTTKHYNIQTECQHLH